MDKCTHEIRAEYWSGIIKACNERPKGQTAKKWLEENDICEQSYYHWLRRLRNETFEILKQPAQSSYNLPAVSEKQEVSFVEISCDSALKVSKSKEPDNTVIATLQTSSVRIEITDKISEKLLSTILREVSHA